MEQTNVNVRNCNDVVDFLTNFQFSRLSYDDKLFVKELGTPHPDLSKSLINPGHPSRSFVNSWYLKCNWLTGSTARNKLFCWPCILFSNSSEKVWSKSGYSDLKNLARSIDKHAKSQEHVSSTCKLHLLGKQNIATLMDTSRKINIDHYNNSVKKNREILKRLIDICIFLCNQDLAFRGHDERRESLNRGNFKELVSLMSKRDEILQNFFDSNSVFSGTSKTIQNELLDSIAAKISGYFIDRVENPFNSKSSFLQQYLHPPQNYKCVSQLNSFFILALKEF